MPPFEIRSWIRIGPTVRPNAYYVRTVRVYYVQHIGIGFSTLTEVYRTCEQGISCIVYRHVTCIAKGVAHIKHSPQDRMRMDLFLSSPCSLLNVL